MTLSAKQRSVVDIVKAHRAPIIGYGGSSGSGKSDLLRKGSLYTCLLNRALGFPGARAVLATSQYTLLRDRHLHRLGDDEFRLFGKVVTSQTYGLCFRFHDEDNGVIALRNLDDPDKYRGTEATAGIWIDEATELPNTIQGRDMLPFLLVPIRRGKVEYPHTPAVLASNSDGIGHAYMKGAFITGTKRFDIDPARFHFVKALPGDNPYKDDAWLTTLAGLPEWIRKARLEGSWDMPEGARFPTLSKERHSFKMAERFPHGIPLSWRRVVSIDWGTRDPYSALWHAFDPAPGGKVYTYRGDYQARVITWHQAERVRDLTGPHERISVVKGDPSMWNTEPNYHLGDPAKDQRVQLRSASDDYIAVLGQDPRFGAVVPGPRLPFRGVGFNSLDTLLHHELWEIEEGCTALWGELEAAIFNDTVKHGGRAEDLAPDCADHAITCAVYGLHQEVSGLIRGMGEEINDPRSIEEERRKRESFRRFKQSL